MEQHGNNNIIYVNTYYHQQYKEIILGKKDLKII